MAVFSLKNIHISEIVDIVECIEVGIGFKLHISNKIIQLI